MAQRQQLLRTQGNAQLARTLPDWLGICLFAEVRSGDPQMMKIAAAD